ncbi:MULTISPECIES: SDR family NAD(P)-dependent oxidoreductase [Cryobacterium]|uniref:3-oxoacyl-[acyl-carrier protein] reductase n=1 Tax=Cryobacterium levicorallinum TaxID=995038 RepID=A0A1I2YG44_9MICO|nr:MULTISPECIES: SDR family NAD(P)-dependent oxidoreductase [Cryobacterium]TFB85940.1 SDR family oxidoreductase [Cryobacterium levicorallinum]TFD60469.1 SDR family oxidoreductase [Cryobacterium sp. Hh38]GEP27084.1 3-oxoacyl-ACP reductase [Cryobacterium levicorallinum]SFH24624.1 3-oxoacyl-[acyl-carrier protein] reductase [Cryobacterium levicorallinum]
MTPHHRASTGRGVVVTGGSSGIGRAIAEAFVANGDRVVILDRAGTDIDAINVDVSQEDSVRTAFATARQRLGTIDVLVNSAGLLTESPLQNMTLAMWNETLSVDLTGVFLCCREVVGEMRQQKWGRIINIASQLAIKGGTGLSHYSAAKAGVVALTKSLALEVASDNVLVNSIAPGPIETPLVQGISEDWKIAKRAELPLRRFGVAAEVAPTALLLASEPGGNLYVGQTLGPNSGDVMQ